MSTITLTFGDVCENHVNMQKLGELATQGLTLKDLENAQKKFRCKCKCELIRLRSPDDEEGYILIIRKGVYELLHGRSSIDLLTEQKELEVDKKAFMYGRVVNKISHYNLCFAEQSQEPDYENKKGRVVAFDEVPLLKMIREKLPEYVGEKARNLFAEGNYYYDVKKTGIGYHGDAERKIVIALRLGASMPLCFQWYKNSKPVGETKKLMLNDGDVYMMSEKATGNDWKTRKIYTLRHSAGCDKYTTVTREEIINSLTRTQIPECIKTKNNIRIQTLVVVMGASQGTISNYLDDMYSQFLVMADDDIKMFEELVIRGDTIILHMFSRTKKGRKEYLDIAQKNGLTLVAIFMETKDKEFDRPEKEEGFDEIYNIEYE
jgi:alkylated DNA repair dioxygenase AlkB